MGIRILSEAALKAAEWMTREILEEPSMRLNRSRSVHMRGPSR